MNSINFLGSESSYDTNKVFKNAKKFQELMDASVLKKELSQRSPIEKSEIFKREAVKNIDTNMLNKLNKYLEKDKIDFALKVELKDKTFTEQFEIMLREFLKNDKLKKIVEKITRKK